MAQTNERVLAMVRDELRKNPAISTADLFAKAKKYSKDVAGLDIRQFHARYPLQIKRSLSPRKRRRGAARKANAGAAQPSAAKSAATNGTGKRGPGRPRKNATPSATSTAGRASTPSGNRSAVRNVLLQFAKDIAGAEQRSQFIDVIAGIDNYVEQVIRAAS